MIGTYTFKQGGDVIGKADNLITTAGRKAILDYMAGYVQRLAGSIPVGIGTTAATVNDKTLDFEVASASITLSSVDYAAGAVVYKAQLSAETACTIYEAGLRTLSSVDASSAQMLMDFDESDLWTVGTYSPTNSRIGTALRVTSPASTSTTSSLGGIFYDLSDFNGVDEFSFAFRANNSFVSSVVLRLKTDATNYYSVSFPSPASGVYNIMTFAKSIMTVTGSPDWSNITSADIIVTSTAGGTGGVDFDALRIEDVDSVREDNVLVSRAVLAAPITKVVGIPLDIEYAITL